MARIHDQHRTSNSKWNHRVPTSETRPRKFESINTGALNAEHERKHEGLEEPAQPSNNKSYDSQPCKGCQGLQENIRKLLDERVQLEKWNAVLQANLEGFARREIEAQRKAHNERKAQAEEEACTASATSTGTVSKEADINSSD